MLNESDKTTIIRCAQKYEVAAVYLFLLIRFAKLVHFRLSLTLIRILNDKSLTSCGFTQDTVA